MAYCKDAKPSCEQIIDILPDPFVIIDRDFRIVAANQHYCRHYGLSSDDIVGRRCHEVSHRSEQPCSQHGEHCPMDEVFQTGKMTQVLHIHYDSQGGEEHVQLQCAPILGPDGKVLYMGEYINPVRHPGTSQGQLIGRSPAFLRMVSLLQRVAPTQTSVLLQGESGVGKECVAEYIHQYSTRVQGPYVVVDCTSLGSNLIESELFGHEKGSFTGAAARKKGLFEVAQGGTLFIDEVGELPLELQTKLLRVLETGTIRRIGGTEYLRVDVRVIAATNRDLAMMVEDGSFRADLYYRLTAFPVRIPSLRERKDDIPQLAEHFLARMEEGDRHIPISTQVIEGLLNHNYPGNIRELRNIIERAAILACDDVLRPDHLVFDESNHNNEIRLSSTAILNRRRGRLTEKEVMHALERHRGHRVSAAQELGVSERTLYRYIQRIRA